MLVVTDSYKQDWTTKIERRIETEDAMEILGANFGFLGLSDVTVTKEEIKEKLRLFNPDKVYAPSGSHQHHAWVGEVALELWPKKTRIYTTYDKHEFHVKGDEVIWPTDEEKRLKNEALDCYKSQLVKNAPHFDAVRGGCEYLDECLENYS